MVSGSNPLSSHVSYYRLKNGHQTNKVLKEIGIRAKFVNYLGSIVNINRRGDGAYMVV